MKPEFIEKFNTLKKVPKDKQLFQQRGRDFEELINNIFQDENVLLKRGFHSSDNKSEQIDGAIEIDKRIFLIETKWVKSNLAASDLFAFIGKIENKFFGTLGIFISREKLSKNFINALNKGRRQVVLVIHGQDVDLLFDPKNSISISEYISYTLKVCSYDNVLQFPVEKFLAMSKPNTSVKEVENLDEESIQFIRTNLWKIPISEDDLLLKIDENDSHLNNKIFEKIIYMYSDIYNINFKNLNFDFTILDNFNKFLKQFNAEKETLSNTAKEYYTKLIFKDFNVYHRELFTNNFSGYYSNLSADEKNEVEKKLITKFNVALKNSDWNLENYITDILKPIWKDVNIKNDFKSFYLSIYLRDTKDKFSQKKFANELVQNDEINIEFVKNWLTEKIKNVYEEYDKKVDENDIKFIARTYLALNKILNIDNWLEYINSIFDNVRLQIHEND